jgi:hypothetical protein
LSKPRRDFVAGNLERSYEQKEYEMIALLKVHPLLDPLRGDPRFEKLVNKVVPPDSKK